VFSGAHGPWAGTAARHGKSARGPCCGPRPRQEHEGSTARSARRPGKARRRAGTARHGPLNMYGGTHNLDDVGPTMEPRDPQMGPTELIICGTHHTSILRGPTKLIICGTHYIFLEKDLQTYLNIFARCYVILILVLFFNIISHYFI
jgi:hypothetical protein